MNAEKKSLKKHFWGILVVLNVLLIFAYHSPKNSYFLVHDYLDHLFVLYKLRGDNPHFFDYSAPLNGVLGNLPLSALGISDLALDANLFVFFEPELAAVLNEIFARNIAFIGMYIFLRKFLPLEKHQLVVTAPALLYALLAYYPNFLLTIAFIPLIGYVALISKSQNLKTGHYLLVFATSIFGNFTYGGFVSLLGVLMFALIQIFRRNFQSSCRLVSISAVLALGYFFGISRILFLKFQSDFDSHRSSWEPLTQRWFDPSQIHLFIQEFLSVTLRGIYHFPSGQSVLTQLFVPGVPIILLSIYSVLQLNAWIHRPAQTLTESRNIRYVILLILVTNVFYACEASNLTQFEYLASEPFQFKRLAVILPFLWCVLFALLLSKMRHQISWLVPICLILVLLQVSVSNTGVRQKALDYLGLQSNRPTVSEYFERAKYLGLAQKIDRHPSQISVVSFDLDPMIASFNGYASFDGYAYNYPLEYKISFRRIIRQELAADQDLRDYYDGWGSRVYLFHQDLPSRYTRLDFCAARKLGAQFVLSKKNLSLLDNLTLFEEYRGLKLYRIYNC